MGDRDQLGAIGDAAPMASAIEVAVHSDRPRPASRRGARAGSARARYWRDAPSWRARSRRPRRCAACQPKDCARLIDLGRCRGEEDFVLMRAPRKARHAARGLVVLRGEVGQIMQAAVDVGVFAWIGRVIASITRLRLLRAGAVVEIDQRLAVHRQPVAGNCARIASMSYMANPSGASALIAGTPRTRACSSAREASHDGEGDCRYLRARSGTRVPPRDRPRTRPRPAMLTAYLAARFR